MTSLPARLREKCEWRIPDPDGLGPDECHAYITGACDESKRITPILERLIECVEALERYVEDESYQNWDALLAKRTALRDCLGEE